MCRRSSREPWGRSRPGVCARQSKGGNGAWLRPGNGGLRGKNADEFPHAPAILVLDEPVDQGKQGIVPPQSDVFARLQARPALPDQDRASGDKLAAEALHSQTLGVAVAT